MIPYSTDYEPRSGRKTRAGDKPLVRGEEVIDALIPVINNTPVCPVCQSVLVNRQRCPNGHVETEQPIPTPPGQFCEKHLNWGCWEDKLDCWQEVRGFAPRNKPQEVPG